MLMLTAFWLEVVKDTTRCEDAHAHAHMTPHVMNENM